MSTKSPFYIKRTQRDYPLTFKLSIVKSVESGRFTPRQAQRHYGIQGTATILVWLRKYGTLDWSSSKRTTMSGSSEKSPQERIRELEAALEEERKKVLFLSTAMKIAEQQYGMQFKKNSSPKLAGNSKKKRK